MCTFAHMDAAVVPNGRNWEWIKEWGLQIRLEWGCVSSAKSRQPHRPMIRGLGLALAELLSCSHGPASSVGRCKYVGWGVAAQYQWVLKLSSESPTPTKSARRALVIFARLPLPERDGWLTHDTEEIPVDQCCRLRLENFYSICCRRIFAYL